MASTAGLRLEKLGVIQQTVNTWISDIRTPQKVGRDIVISRLNRLGWPQEQIAEKAGVNQQRVSQITNNTKFGDIGNLIAQGRDMEYIAKHYNMDLALAWALRLAGKTDQEKFKALEWGLRPRDQWYFNKCDERSEENGACITSVSSRPLRSRIPFFWSKRLAFIRNWKLVGTLGLRGLMGNVV